MNQFRERISYDGNGNILTYLRRGHRSAFAMDNLSYVYYNNSNKLNRVDDQVSAGAYGTTAGDVSDIDDQAADNYTYDEIGNLIKDNAEKITGIKWSVYGKILEISKTASASNPVQKIVYTYDAQGNRISKALYKNNGTVSYTWYVRDAQGNTMATYQSSGSSSASNLMSLPLNVAERHLYGSSRLGIYSRIVDVDGGPADMANTNAYTYYRGFKQYELSNHLGNVLATITDKKKAIDIGNNGSIDYYDADITTAQDYYPFGMLMPGRIGYASSTGWTSEPGGNNSGNNAPEADIAFSEPREQNLPLEYEATNSIEFNPGFESGSGDVFLAYISPAEEGGGSGGSGSGSESSLNNGYYRYGFNGKEMDSDVKGSGNQYDYGFRIYDPRIGKFLSIDPLTKSYPMPTPYQFASNRPIDGLDLDGLEWQKVQKYDIANPFKNQTTFHVKLKVVNESKIFKDVIKLKQEIQNQFASAFEKLNNDPLHDYAGMMEVEIVDKLNKGDFGVLILDGPKANKYGSPVAGQATSFNTKENDFSVNGSRYIDKTREIKNAALVAQDIVHEIIHTAGLIHPQDDNNIVSDVDLVPIYKNGKFATYKLNKNVQLDNVIKNIMIYPDVKIDYKKVKEYEPNTFERKNITSGQAKEISKKIDEDNK